MDSERSSGEPPQRTRRSFAATWLFVAMAFYGAATWFVLRPDGSASDPGERRFAPDAGTYDAGTYGHPLADEGDSGLWDGGADPVEAMDCTPRAELRCAEGDVYWFDGCGERQERAEECGFRPCGEGQCAKTAGAQCRGLPPEGLCDGEVVRGCIGGLPFSRDCAELGKRCVVGSEGALCIAASEQDCEHHGRLPRCEDNALLQCIAGQVRRTDCAAAGALCGTLPGAGFPACQHLSYRPEAPIAQGACGPCGCDEPFSPQGKDRCDGRDNDGDGTIDEDERCPPIPIIAFILTDSAGNSAYSQQDVRDEMARIAAVLAGGPPELELSVDLLDVVHLRQPNYRELDEQEFSRLLDDRSVVARQDAFYVPVIFTDQVVTNDVPKMGISTLPNGLCGGRRVSAHEEPSAGAVAVAKNRSPTTATHEIGHYFGLCHTHYAESAPFVNLVRWSADNGDLMQLQCDAPCALSGDGICDTAEDPGPDRCHYDELCQVQCENAATPDPRNVMSYYTDCRQHLSRQQALTLRQGYAIRRGIYRCRTPDRCPCEPYGDACPEEMTCRPYGQRFACQLDGPSREGNACTSQVSCAGDLVCASDNRCHRLCTPTEGQCDCQPDTALGMAVCL